MRFAERLRGAEAGPPVFAPLVTRLVAHLEQVSADHLERDAGALARTLKAARQLLHLDAIVLDGVRAVTDACASPPGSAGPWWRSFEPEDLRGHPRLATLADAVGRLRSEVPAGTALIVRLPGPWALAAALGGASDPPEEGLEAAGEACARAARALSEARVDAVMVCEGIVPARHVEEAGGGLRSACNAVRYYEVGSVVCLPEAEAAEGPLGDGAGPDVVVVPAGAPAGSRRGGSGRGLALAPLAFTAAQPERRAIIREALAAAPGFRLVTTAGEVPAESTPEVVREVLGILRAVAT